jgi:hypothetical protein
LDLSAPTTLVVCVLGGWIKKGHLTKNENKLTVTGLGVEAACLPTMHKTLDFIPGLTHTHTHTQKSGMVV